MLTLILSIIIALWISMEIFAAIALHAWNKLKQEEEINHD
jgi:hypothetical protein